MAESWGQHVAGRHAPSPAWGMRAERQEAPSVIERFDPVRAEVEWGNWINLVCSEVGLDLRDGSSAKVLEEGSRIHQRLGYLVASIWPGHRVVMRIAFVIVIDSVTEASHFMHEAVAVGVEECAVPQVLRQKATKGLAGVLGLRPELL